MYTKDNGKNRVSISKSYNYEQLLKEVHPDFCRRLTERAPNITPLEIVNCVLARLHVPVKEAASILSLSTASVEKHRSHVRTKLGVERSQNLVSVLHSI
jgi:DNA-binding CsgD family transcriptional regulator